ncbi:diguanylate cyclase [Labrenzia sp. PHM005]|uniref:bifunctional diguanylate cyclase/phosphodiesterase n=1 Tax=Labrenzia sp. PHM005 TaxID=2590016 RepID=UPI0011406EF3|nr:diguanylate cyclase [Labrenzia sp. PHM005]QDG78623.1 diguanylate cyclase [Labrenzia sp. PHM005]
MTAENTLADNALKLREAFPEPTAEAQQHLFANLIAEHCSDSIVFTDPQGKVLWVNEPFRSMTGYSLSEILGKKPGSLLQGPDTDPNTVSEISQALRSQVAIDCEILNYTKNGESYWIDLTITPVRNHDGVLTHFMSIERDITEKKKLAEETKKSLQSEQEQRRERKILSQMSEWLFAARSQQELEKIVAKSMDKMFPGTNGAFYIYSNSRDVLEQVGQWGNLSSPTHIHADDCWSLRRGRSYAYGTSDISFACEHVHESKHAYFCLPIVAHGDTIGMMHIAFPEYNIGATDNRTLRDALANKWDLSLICAEQISLATANVKLQDELHQRSVKDPLTGLWNRRWFNETASREIKRFEENGTPLTLMIIDIDHFKKFNDTFGHDAGDIVLKSFGVALQEVFENNRFACRLGGEEFCILCVGDGMDQANEQLAVLRETIAGKHIRYDGHQLPTITFSTGIAEYRPEDGDLKSFVCRSDEALYAAKKAGRNCDMIASEHAL